MQSATPPPDDSRRSLTDTDIVAGLRSEDPEKRRVALEALCGLHGGVFMLSTLKENRVTATNNLNAYRAFAGLLFIAQQLGKAMGLQLNWVPDAPHLDQNKLVIANPEHLPPTR